MPATGVPLPLMSVGGTMFIITMLSFALVQSVYANSENIDSD
jgi:cell division protein FtsW (lipid II flippase)